jgi:DNA-binding NtrC family response regulator
MAKVLIIDDQLWVKDICKEGLGSERHQVSATNDVVFVQEKISSFKPDIVLLNFYLKHGALVWDVLREIKLQNPKLPVIVVTQYETNLFSPRLAEADGYLVKSPTATDELRTKVSELFE